ncbi:Sodium channel subunit beta-3 [Nibea albiflora]|uniref:Sodium channel subunit beta-3 n=1 Tax=Nibea albiflora TaxID=240163 RepID=A0ACB7EIU5_NIBAL|nr:Sodium channel subunit beta-3 [Nibea albiflora]
MKLTCIACLKREEIKPKTQVDWYYMPKKEKNKPSNKTHIFMYKNGAPVELDGPFKGRLAWNGSQDLQDVSILILNATFDDSGVYECQVLRKFEFDFFTPSAYMSKDIKLIVIEKASQDSTAVYSEIMMYVLLVFLTFWLLVEMVYCYRKISKSDEQAEDTARWLPVGTADLICLDSVKGNRRNCWSVTQEVTSVEKKGTKEIHPKEEKGRTTLQINTSTTGAPPEREQNLNTNI